MAAKKYQKMDSRTDEEVREFKRSSLEKQFRKQEKFLRTATKALKVSERPIVAEGDSWFDYGSALYSVGTDLIDCLRGYHDLNITNFSDAGDTLENMAYGTRYTRDFERRQPTIVDVLKEVARVQPRVFLFSGGGNDVAGDEFGSYLNHSESRRPTLRESYVGEMVDGAFRRCIEDVVSKIRAVSPKTHIVTHGYGNTVPTGKGVKVIGFRFAGPWLKPALVSKSILDAKEQRRAVDFVIDRFNDMLAFVMKAHSGYFHYVDLRSHIDPKTDWDNELHLKNSAFATCADRLAKVIVPLLV